MSKIVIDSSVFDWYDKNTVLLFVYLLTHADDEGIIETTMSRLSDELGITYKQVRNSLSKLCKGNQMAIKRAIKSIVINICDFGTYKISENIEGQSKGQSKGNQNSKKAIKRAIKRAIKEPCLIPFEPDTCEELKMVRGQSKGQLNGQSETNLKKYPQTPKEKNINNYINLLGEGVIRIIIGDEHFDEPRDIDLRRIKFYISLQEFEPELGKDLVMSFFEYWSEYNRSNTKMKFEMQQTFQIKRRLNMWKRKDAEWSFSGRGRSLEIGQAHTDDNKQSINDKANF